MESTTILFPSRNLVTVEELEVLMNEDRGPIGLVVKELNLEQFSNFFSLVGKTESIKSLIMKDVRLGVRGALRLNEALLSNKNITQLDVSSCGLGEEGIEVLSEGIAEQGDMEILCVDNNGIRTESAQHLTTALGSLNNLKELSIAKNNFSAKGFEFVTNFLRKARLRVLNLRNNTISAKGVKTLAYIIKDNACHFDSGIEELDMSKCKLTDTMANDLAQAIERNEYMKILNLSSNSISSTSAISKAVELSNIEEFVFDKNRLGYGSESAIINSILGRHNTHVRVLSLNDNNIQNVQDLSDALADDTTLEILKICGNQITDNDLLVESLIKNTTLKELHTNTMDSKNRHRILKNRPTLQIITAEGDQPKREVAISGFGTSQSKKRVSKKTCSKETVSSSDDESDGEEDHELKSTGIKKSRAKKDEAPPKSSRSRKKIDQSEESYLCISDSEEHISD